MLNITRRLHEKQPAAAQLVLPFELRQKSRLRVRLSSGAEAGLFLERGGVLRGGDLLLADDGTVVEVVAAAETVSTVRSADPGHLLRAAYHLGNRHVPVQIGEGWLRYGHDHVLDEMVRGLQLQVLVEQAPFEPEAGAYGHSHAHATIAPHAHGATGAHAHGATGAHAHGATGLHAHGVAGPHAHGVAGPHVHGSAGPHVHGSAGPHVHGSAGTHVHGSAGTHVHGSAGTHADGSSVAHPDDTGICMQANPGPPHTHSHD